MQTDRPVPQSPLINRMRAALCTCLVAWLGCAGDVVAQGAPQVPPDELIDLIDQPALRAPAFPWGGIVLEWDEPRYKVEAIRFKARDEFGFDWLGSDEVIVETVDAEGWTVSEEIGSIDLATRTTSTQAGAASCPFGPELSSSAIRRTAQGAARLRR